MPHITIEMLPGRSESVKENLAQTITETVAQCVNVSPTDVSVMILEVEKSNWKDHVYNRIMREKQHLYRQPKAEN